MKASHFETHLSKLLADSNYLLSEEFEVGCCSYASSIKVNCQLWLHYRYQTLKCFEKKKINTNGITLHKVIYEAEMKEKSILNATIYLYQFNFINLAKHQRQSEKTNDRILYNYLHFKYVFSAASVRFSCLNC